MAKIPDEVTAIIGKIEDAVVNPILILLFAVAFLVFIWGVFTYIVHADDPTKRSEGGKGMIYGVIGMFIMFSVFGIINLIASTVQGL
ncbi:MAG: Uncharacterized protein CEO19_54 [Parcubacteria group bacterium Gr01-1014_73]|nr:MAG: Uncharacterized protein CEO19_54 [Parcubacteria group bacterium Gr01-1014_73]